MKKQNVVIVGVVAFILAIAVGYALFTDTLTINGTATAKGNFDIQFENIDTSKIVKHGYTETNDENGDGTLDNIAVVSDDKNTLTVTVNKLDYPGAYVEIPVTVTNVGSIPAKLKNIVQTGLETDEGPIKVTYSGIAATETPINKGDSQNMVIRVEWLENVESNASKASFTITLEYEQITS